MAHSEDRNEVWGFLIQAVLAKSAKSSLRVVGSRVRLLRSPELTNSEESLLAVALSIAALLKRYYNDGHFQSEASLSIGRWGIFLELSKTECFERISLGR